MPSNYEKYKLTRKVMGKTSLVPYQHEAIADMVANKVPVEHIQLEFKLTPEALQVILDEPMVQRRIAYKLKLKTPYIPKTAEQCLEYAIKHLVRLGRKAKTDKDKVSALKNVAEIAIELKKDNKNKAPAPIQVNMDLLDDLDKESE